MSPGQTITARRGACIIKKMSRSHRSLMQTGWFSLRFHRKTTPSSRSAEASRYLFGRSATPPCGDARRGLALPVILHFGPEIGKTVSFCKAPVSRWLELFRRFAALECYPIRRYDVRLAKQHGE